MKILYNYMLDIYSLLTASLGCMKNGICGCTVTFYAFLPSPASTSKSNKLHRLSLLRITEGTKCQSILPFFTVFSSGWTSQTRLHFRLSFHPKDSHHRNHHHRSRVRLGEAFFGQKEH